MSFGTTSRNLLALFFVAFPLLAEAQNKEGGTISGDVVDTTGRPLRGVEVLIPDIAVRTRTDSMGAFLLAGVKPGRYEIWFRRVGLIVVQYSWESRPNAEIDIRVRMRPLPQTLDPVMVYASEERAMKARSMVSGTITTEVGSGLGGVEVQLIGAGRVTTTASDGTYIFRHVLPGDLAVRARLIGYAPITHRFTLLQDDERTVRLKLSRLPQELDTVSVTAESGFGPQEVAWRDYGDRVRWRQSGGSSVYLGPERLQSLGAIPLDLALRGVPGGFGRTNLKTPAPPSIIEGDVCILENGLRPLSRPLRVYAASDLEMVEYYPPPPPETELTGTVAARMSSIRGCGGRIGAHPAYYVLWFKESSGR